MRRHSHRALWLSLALAVLACQRPPDIADDLESYADLLSEANFYACNCPQDVGFSSEVECGDALGSVGPFERDCLADVLEGHEEEAQDYFACVNDAYQSYVYCLEVNESCTEGWYDDCTQEHENDVAACPQLPSGVDAQFAACID